MPTRNRRKICAPGCRLAALLLLAAALSGPTADGRTRHHRKPSPVSVVLEPFLVAHTVVSTVAKPIVSHAPAALVTLATAPLHIASAGGRAIYQGTVVPAPAENSESVRVAYLAPRAQRFDPAATEDEPSADSGFQRNFAATSEDGHGPTVAGNRAILRNGIAYAPARAPQSVKNAIWAANTLRDKPYVWGGGHGSFFDRGYDCSGTVSFALHGAGAIERPLLSSDFLRYGESGRGRWITIYARPGHTFAVIAGLRLDTTDFIRGGNVGPRWHVDLRDSRGYTVRHPVDL